MATMSYHNLPKNDTNANHDAPHDGASDPETQPTDPEDSTGVKDAKAFGIGLACLVGVPVGAALLTVGGVLYGAGKVMEGVGQGLAAGPEAAFRAGGEAGVKPAAPPKQQQKHQGKKS